MTRRAYRHWRYRARRTASLNGSDGLRHVDVPPEREASRRLSLRGKWSRRLQLAMSCGYRPH